MNGLIKNHKKRPGYYLKVLLMILLFAPWPGFANSESQTVGELLPPIDLQHEPIQPLFSIKKLNPDKVSLGKKLFHEPRLAHNNDMACASCHFLQSGGADCHIQSRGRGGSELGVNSLTVFNSSLNHRLFWDGRARTLEEQIDFVVTNPLEFATQWPVLINKLKQNNEYKKSFGELYSDGITAANIRNAIATFERSLITVNSRFDQYLRGDVNAISALEKSGYQLFKSYGCIACHQGRNVGGNMFQKLGVIEEFFDGEDAEKKGNLGRFNVTGHERDRHVFRVPSLRLVVLTPPYFHNGSAKTLYDAIKVMAKYQLGRTIPDDDIKRIIAFLKTLPGEYQGQPLSGVYDESPFSEHKEETR